MRLIKFLIDDHCVLCIFISNSTFEVIEDITIQMKEIFPDKNVRDVKFIEENKNSFEEKFVF